MGRATILTAANEVIMSQYIAFLRAINVGGRNIKMDKLRGHFEDMGFENVESFIASGNIIFETERVDRRALEQPIEAHLEEALGYEVATFVRTVEEVGEIAGYTPFVKAMLERDGSNLYVGFVAEPPDNKAVERLHGHATEIDSFHVNGREVYWLCNTSSSQSDFSGAKLERALGRPATMRNIRTVRRLAKKYGDRNV
jgi:uncharacterized protein (DUF1697 family)